MITATDVGTDLILAFLRPVNMERNMSLHYRRLLFPGDVLADG